MFGKNVAYRDMEIILENKYILYRDHIQNEICVFSSSNTVKEAEGGCD